MKEFRLLEEYNNQNKKLLEQKQKITNSVKPFEEKVNDLKKKLEEVIADEVTKGVDKTKDKSRLREEIEEAEKELIAAIQERDVGLKFLGDPIHQPLRAIDVVLEYLGPYKQEERKKVLPKIVKQMADARRLYYSAMLDLLNEIDSYGTVVESVRELSKSAHANKQASHLHHIEPPISERDILDCLISDGDLYYIENNRELPKHIEKGDGK